MKNVWGLFQCGTVNRFILTLLLFINGIGAIYSQDTLANKIVETPKASSEKKWYEAISLRGYMQVRYNRLLETNPNLNCEQCDRSWGKGGGFMIRRMRLIFFGQISPRVYFYIQPDLASNASSDRLHFAQLRDAYLDVGLDKENEFRFRIGQSKVPYGFENMQSSQNRLPLDRADAFNSAVPNERDLGVNFYWAPKKIRNLYSELVRSGLKGSGDYGVFGIGVFNGQVANGLELNDSPHYVARVSYPFQFKRQIIEVGLQAYTGKFVLTKSNLSTGVKYKSDLNYLDERFAASVVLYSKPFGILAEYNIGRGPEFNKATDSIELQSLRGGFVTFHYLLNIKGKTINPYLRIQYYHGGKKVERDARSYEVNEIEGGIEWQIFKQFELVTAYTISKRRFEDFSKRDNLQSGRLLRIQAQLNF